MNKQEEATEAAKLRKEIVAEMQRHKVMLSPFVTQDWDSYMRRMSQSGTWGGTRTPTSYRVYPVCCFAQGMLNSDRICMQLQQHVLRHESAWQVVDSRPRACNFGPTPEAADHFYSHMMLLCR